MTILVVNHGIIKCISIVTAVIRTMIQFYVDKLGDCFRKAVQWTLDIPLHLSTLSVLDWDHVHSLSHHLQQQNNTYYLPEGIQ